MKFFWWLSYFNLILTDVQCFGFFSESPIYKAWMKPWPSVHSTMQLLPLYTFTENIDCSWRESCTPHNSHRKDVHHLGCFTELYRTDLMLLGVKWRISWPYLVELRYFETTAADIPSQQLHPWLNIRYHWCTVPCRAAFVTSAHCASFCPDSSRFGQPVWKPVKQSQVTSVMISPYPKQTTAFPCKYCTRAIHGSTWSCFFTWPALHWKRRTKCLNAECSIF